jgi:lipopolysaccharide biosynthesis protein
MLSSAVEVKIDKLFDFDINILVLNSHAVNGRFRDYKYLNYLSYCNQIITEDRDENILYLCVSKYNFNEVNVKTMLEYFIFRWYETQSYNPIIIDSLHELNKGNLLTVIQETMSNLSKEKFEFVKSTQSLKKRKSHALIWHLYHVDMFEEINEEMQDSAELFDIYISINHECSQDDIKKILSVYPFANIFMFENRGRDVLPFLKIFKEIEKLEYNSLCKIHTKKSTHRKDGADWGKVLRQRLFDGKNEILHSFKYDNKIGAYVAKEHLADSSYIGLNRDNVQMTCDILNIKYTDNFDFPFGTMFWCKPEAISQLSSEKLESKYFVIENGELDGTFAHAIERLIGLLVKENGFSIAEI